MLIGCSVHSVTLLYILWCLGFELGEKRKFHVTSQRKKERTLKSKKKKKKLSLISVELSHLSGLKSPGYSEDHLQIGSWDKN